MAATYVDTIADAKRAMHAGRFTHVYVSNARVLGRVRVEGWTNHSNPYDHFGQRWFLYVPAFEIV